MTARLWPGVFAALAGAGAARAVAAFGPDLGLRPPAAPVAGALLGLLAWAGAARLLRGAWGPAGWAFAPGLLCWAARPLADRLGTRALPDLANLGVFRVGESWVQASTATYLGLGVLGLGLTGPAIALAALCWRARRARWVAAALALFLAGAWRVLVFPPSGDEPYMLLSAASLVRDGDLNLAPDFARGDERRIHPKGFRSDFLAAHAIRGSRGEEYNRHGLGLPLLFAPGYAVLGRLGLQALLAAAWAFLLARLARALASAGLPERDAASALAVLAIASPLPLFAVFLGPDLPAALLVTLALGGLLSRARAVWLPAIAALPLLHLKGALLAAGLVLGAAVSSGIAAGAAAAAALAGSLTVLVVVLGALTAVPAWPPWNVLTFSASRFNERFDPRHVPLSSLATLFDRHQGLVHFPLLLLAGAGAVVLWRRNPRLLGVVAACLVPYLAALVSYSQWHGGPGAPARMLVAVLPVLALPLAAGLGALRAEPGGRAILAGGLALGGAASWIMAAVPALAFVSAKGKAEELLARALGWNPLAALPDFGPGGGAPRDWALAAGWLTAAAAGTAWLGRSSALRRPSP